MHDSLLVKCGARLCGSSDFRASFSLVLAPELLMCYFVPVECEENGSCVPPPLSVFPWRGLCFESLFLTSLLKTGTTLPVPWLNAACWYNESKITRVSAHENEESNNI